MEINRITCIIIPFFAMFLASIIYMGNLEQPTTLQFPNQTVTVKTHTGYYSMSPVNIATMIQIVVIVSIAVAVCCVAGIQVFGSGMSGSILPILFLVTILFAVYGVLSALSWNLFMSIPIFGLPIYFGLLIMFIIGVAGLGSGSGGD